MLCSDFILHSWAEAGFSGEREIWCGRDVSLPWWPSRQSICPTRGSEAPCMAPPCTCFALTCFGEGKPGHPCGMPCQHHPSLPSSLPPVPCEHRSSQLPWDRAATIAGPLHPAPAAPSQRHARPSCPFCFSIQNTGYLRSSIPFSSPEEPFPTAWQGPGHIWAAPVHCEGSPVLSGHLPDEDKGSKASAGPALVPPRSRALSPAPCRENRKQEG